MLDPRKMLTLFKTSLDDRRNRAITSGVVTLLLFAAFTANAQPKPESDVIVFTNGDKLAGHFVRSTDASVTFKSDILGDLTIDWSKVKELHTSAKVAVIRKGVKLRKYNGRDGVVVGTLAVADQKIQAPPSPEQIPVSDTRAVIDQAAFEKAMTHRPSFFSDWTGTITAGATLVQATQDSRSFNGAVSLVRAEPPEDWLEPRNRTEFNYAESYGELTQPGTPTIKTSIIHFDGQRDAYFTTSLFGFGEAAFDHNFSQGLSLQQTYNGGVGWTVIKTSKQMLDLKGSMSYIRQQFETGPDQNLIGSVFSEHYNRKLPHGVTLDQHASVTPAWNNTNAYSAAFSALLTMPVYKRLAGSTGVIDTFLNDPPSGFKKNSFQFTLGLTYALQ